VKDDEHDLDLTLSFPTNLDTYCSIVRVFFIRLSSISGLLCSTSVYATRLKEIIYIACVVKDSASNYTRNDKNENAKWNEVLLQACLSNLNNGYYQVNFMTITILILTVSRSTQVLVLPKIRLII